MVTKITKKIGLYAYSFQKCVYIKTICMYFMIRDEMFFDIYMKIL